MFSKSRFDWFSTGSIYPISKNPQKTLRSSKGRAFCACKILELKSHYTLHYKCSLLTLEHVISKQNRTILHRQLPEKDVFQMSFFSLVKDVSGILWFVWTIAYAWYLRESKIFLMKFKCKENNMKIIYDNSYENKSRDSMWKSRVLPSMLVCQPTNIQKCIKLFFYAFIRNNTLKTIRKNICFF